MTQTFCLSCHFQVAAAFFCCYNRTCDMPFGTWLRWQSQSIPNNTIQHLARSVQRGPLPEIHGQKEVQNYLNLSMFHVEEVKAGEIPTPQADSENGFYDFHASISSLAPFHHQQKMQTNHKANITILALEDSLLLMVQPSQKPK